MVAYWRCSSAAKTLLAGSAEMASGLPVFRPRLKQRAANKNIGMRARFLVQDVEVVPGMRGQAARREMILQLVAIPADYAQCLGWRLAIASLPEVIDTADHGRQA